MGKKGKDPQGDKFNGELPKFACKCANEAINDGNAVFGIQNLAECWTGPDDSKYDKDGASNDCVTFDYAPCAESAEICAGKKHSNFVYYVAMWTYLRVVLVMWTYLRVVLGMRTGSSDSTDMTLTDNEHGK